MIGFIAPVQRDHVLGQFLNEFRMMQNNIAPEHHPASAPSDFAMDRFQKVEIHTAFAFSRAYPFALSSAKVPGFITTDIESIAGEMRQQLIVKSAQKREGALMIRRKRRRIAQVSAAGSFVRLADL